MNPKNKANSENIKDHQHPKRLGGQHQLEGLGPQSFWNCKGVIIIDMAIIIYQEVIPSLENKILF